MSFCFVAHLTSSTQANGTSRSLDAARDSVGLRRIEQSSMELQLEFVPNRDSAIGGFPRIPLCHYGN